MVPHPPRFSPEDKYVRLRVEAKRKAGLLVLEPNLFCKGYSE